MFRGAAGERTYPSLHTGFALFARMRFEAAVAGGMMAFTWAREKEEGDATVTTHTAATAAALLASSTTTVLFTALWLRARTRRRRELESGDSLRPERRSNIEDFVR